MDMTPPPKPSEEQECRAAFEAWANDAHFPGKAIERNKDGGYKLMQAACDWRAWQAAWQARPLAGSKAELVADEYNPAMVERILEAAKAEPVKSFTKEEFLAWLEKIENHSLRSLIPISSLIGYARSMPEIEDTEDRAWSRWREGLLEAVEKADEALVRSFEV